MSTLRILIEMELPHAEAKITLQELREGDLNVHDLDFAPEEVTYEISN